MNCKDCSLLLLDYHFDTLEPGERAQVDEHLESCEACRATLARLESSVPDQLSWPDEAPPADLSAKALERVGTELSRVPTLDMPVVRTPRAAARPAKRSPVRLAIKAVAACLLIGVAGWGWSMHHRRVALAASVDGQHTLSPGSLATLRAQVFDVDGHAPIAGARLRILLLGADGKETLVYEGPSDKWGTVSAGKRLPDLPEGGYTLVVHASKGGEETSFTQPITLQRRYRVLLSSDKPTYQPGQTIHVRALAREAGSHRPPDGLPLTFTVIDAKGNKVGRQTAKLDRFGVASLDFALADEILLGTWRIEAEVGGAKSALDLSVSRYTLPKFSVKVTTDKPWYRPGDVVSGRVETRYFFGKPASGAKAKLTAGVFVDKFRPVAEAQGQADDQGVWGFELSLPRALPGMTLTNGSAAVDLAFEIHDAAGQRVEKHHGLTVAEEPMSVTAVAEGGSLAMGIESRLLVLVVRPDGEPVPGAKVKLPMVEGSPQGVTGEDGIAALTFVPRSNRRDVALVVYATDGTSLDRVVEVSVESLPAVVRTERTVYTAGETVAGEIRASSPAGVAFLDVVHDGTTIATHTVTLAGGKGSFAVDLPAEAAGTVTLYAYAPGRDVKRSRKTLFVGEPRALQIALSGDAETYRPGKEAKLTVRVTGEDGKPAVANVGLSVVDESVFALVAKEPALLKAYFLLAEELSKPRFELDPARIVAEGGPRDRAAALLFSQPRPSEIHRLAETSPYELQTRRASLLDAKSRASKTSWGFGLVFLGVLFEGALRFLFEQLFRRFFAGRWWRTGALLLGGGLGIAAKLDGVHELPAVLLGLAPLALTLLVELFVWLLQKEPGIVIGVVTTAVLVSALFLLLWGENLRPLFATRAKVVGGPHAEMSGPARSTMRRRTLNNFGRDLAGAPGPAAQAAPRGDFDDIVTNIRAARAKKEQAAPKAEGGAGEKLAEPTTDKTQVRVRSWFPETMFWSPGVITGADGTATLSFPVADSITSWRVSANASAADGRLGVGQGALRVFQDFFVDIDLPVALTVGDEVEVPIAVHNYLDEPQKVRLEVEQAEWFSTMTPAVQELVLEPQEVRGVPLRLRATDFGKKTITVWAFGGKLQDAIRRDVEVRPDGVRVEEAVGGVLAAQTAVRGRLPPGAIRGSEKVLLRLYPGVFSAVLEGIEGVFRKPYGCFEQTSSATYPNVLVLDYLRRNRQAKPEIEAKAIEYIQLGYQRLLSYEVSGGGFEWFGRAPANQVLTAYGLLEFADMARVYDVDPAVIRRTQEWLISRQKYDGTWEPDRKSLRDGLYRDELSGRYGTTAYITWALLESGYRGEATDRALSYLATRAGEADDAYTLSLVANALLAGGREHAASSVLERIEAKAQERDGKVWYPAGGRTAVYSAGSSADVETTSLALLALNRAARADKAEAALDWLLSKRDALGGWGSTQATVLALRTLLRSDSAGQDATANADVQVRFAGETVEQIEIRPESSDLVRTFDLTRFAKPGVPLELELAMTGKARAQYQLVTLAWVPKPRREESLVLSVDYDRVTLAPDDTITARARATWKQRGPTGMVMLALGIPPGFEVEASSVGQLVAEGKVGRFTITGKELLLYVDGLAPNLPTEFAYKLKARYPVKAKAPASLAYLYYQPEVKAESGTVDLLVKR